MGKAGVYGAAWCGHRDVDSGKEVTEKDELGTESCRNQPRRALSLAGKVGVEVTGPSASCESFSRAEL